MPNWCNNNVTFSFNTEQAAQEFFKVVEDYNENQSDNTLFGWFVPIDEEDNNWSRAEKLGTKWDAQLYDWHMDGNSVYLGFDTAWGPPVEVFRAALDKGIQVSASYYEPGMCFVGSFDEDGQEEFYEYGNETASTVREFIGEHLDDMWAISEQMAEWEAEEAHDNDGGVENFG